MINKKILLISAIISFLLLFNGYDYSIVGNSNNIVTIELSLLAVSYAVFSFIQFPIMQLYKENIDNKIFMVSLKNMITENEENIKYMFYIIVFMLIFNYISSVDIPFVESDIMINGKNLKTYIIQYLINFSTVTFLFCFYDVLSASLLLFKSQFNSK